MIILSELKKEYNTTIECLTKASFALKTAIHLGKRLQFLSYNLKDFAIRAEKIKIDSSELETMQKTIDNYIDKLDEKLFSYITDDVEEVEAWVDMNMNLSYIFEEETDD